MKTNILRILSLITIASFTIIPSLTAQDTKIMPVDEVRQGMKGFGKTVFQGTTIERFDVEVLGVLKNFAPKQDMILVRLSGGPLERTGVIAGMSGSPVFIDGKLLGAVAFAFPFAKEPIAGVQPIQQMLDILDQKPGNTPKVAQASSGILPAESPTAFVFGQLQKLAEGVPIQQLLLPQSNGTVTYVDGNRVYAFGHPNLTAGPTDVPMSAGYVISLLPNVQNSFKLAVPLDVVGAFQQDRSTGIAGTLGATSKMIPVSVTLTTSMNTVNKYNFELAADRFLTPPLMNFVVFNAITASERALGEMTLSISGKIHLKNNEPVNIGNVFSSDMNGPVMASIAAVSPLQYLLASGYDGMVVEKVDLEITSIDRKTNAQLERIAVDKTEVRPGETINLTSYLRGTDGATVTERHPVQIPAGLPAGLIQLVVGDGTTVTGSELRRGPSSVPTDLKQVIHELNKLRKNDRLYIKILSFEPGAVIGGQEMPSLPPSMAALINTDRSSSRSVSGTANSTVREYELPQSKFVIQGQRSLSLTVKP